MNTAASATEMRQRRRFGPPAPRSYLLRQCDRVEIVEEGGDAAGVGLVHDRPRAARRGDHVEAADALLDPRDVARRHRQVAQAEAEQEGGKARLASHFA